MVRIQAHGLQAPLKSACCVGDGVLKVLVVEGQNEVVAVSQSGSPQACGHLTSVAYNTVDEQRDSVRLGNARSYSYEVWFVPNSEVIADIGGGQDRIVV